MRRNSEPLTGRPALSTNMPSVLNITETAAPKSRSLSCCRIHRACPARCGHNAVTAHRLRTARRAARSCRSAVGRVTWRGHPVGPRVAIRERDLDAAPLRDRSFTREVELRHHRRASRRQPACRGGPRQSESRSSTVMTPMIATATMISMSEMPLSSRRRWVEQVMLASDRKARAKNAPAGDPR